MQKGKIKNRCDNRSDENLFTIKHLFDFLIRPYLNIKTLGTLAHVCTTFREYAIIDSNQVWFQYYYIGYTSKYNKNLQIRQILSQFTKEQKRLKPIYEPCVFYYFRVVFMPVFSISSGKIRDLQEKISTYISLIKVTSTQKDQLSMIYPDKPLHIAKAINNCDLIISQSKEATIINTKRLHTLLLGTEIKTQIRHYEMNHIVV
jgi:hypothetical protein